MERNCNLLFKNPVEKQSPNIQMQISPFQLQYKKKALPSLPKFITFGSPVEAPNVTLLSRTYPFKQQWSYYSEERTNESRVEMSKEFYKKETRPLMHL